MQFAEIRAWRSLTIPKASALDPRNLCSLFLAARMDERSSILAIRLSALGDIIHALPAIASLKQSFPLSRLSMLIAPRWHAIVEGNPFIDELIPPNIAEVRRLRPDLAFDFQGLLKSALLGRLARPPKFYGFHRSVARESLAPLFYTHPIRVTGPHRVERCLQLIAAAGATQLTDKAWIPPGRPEGELPTTPFVLASPFAGWVGKQWPLGNYEVLGRFLSHEGLELVANVPGDRVAELAPFGHVGVHTSSIAGLIDATRRAAAILGVDSGPLHVAAALRKPGVALFGPTDPKLTGPYGGSIYVLRASGVETTYKRHGQIHSSMCAITPRRVAEALLHSLAKTTVPRP
jgi:heptosyltransferase I